MGNLSWFHEGQTHGAGRRAEDANPVNVFASYRHRGLLHMADGMEVASDIAFRSLPDLGLWGLRFAEIEHGGVSIKYQIRYLGGGLTVGL